MRLRNGTAVTIANLPGTWLALHPTPDREGWWRIVPKTSTPGLEALASCGTLDARRKDIFPLHQTETLL